MPHSATRAESMRRLHASRTEDERKAGTKKARFTMAVNEIRRQVAESRLRAGLPEHVEANRFLDDLAAEVLGGGQHGT